MEELVKNILIERKNHQKLLNLQHEKENPKIDTTKTLAPYLKVSFNTIFQSENKEEESFDKVPEHCIPIQADVRFINWQKLGESVQFDVIVMDPPCNSNFLKSRDFSFFKSNKRCSNRLFTIIG